MNQLLRDTSWLWLPVLMLLGVVASCVAHGGTFGQRCARIYQDAALERCIDRLSAGGPLYEENIGKMRPAQ